MNRKLLEFYNTELSHIREMAGEFAREFPKIAGRLALDKDAKQTCADPFVERLLEGFAFLSARVQLKLDSDFPRFTQSLMDTVYPHYLAPTPSMGIVRFNPDFKDAALASGFPMPRGTSLRSLREAEERTACEYRTAHDVTLWPLEITDARYFLRNLDELQLDPALGARAAIRIRIRAQGVPSLSALPLDSLNFFLRGEDNIPVRIYEQLFSHALAVLTRPSSDRNNARREKLPPSAIQRCGFRENQSLLPNTARGFEGYRMLREYFTLPQRCLFFDLEGLRPSFRRCDDTSLDLVIPLSTSDPKLEDRISPGSFDLFCTPIINLFSKRTDRVPVSPRFSEFHVVPDRVRTLDYEIFEVEQVTGYGLVTGDEEDFMPFFRSTMKTGERGAFYTAYRLPRELTEKERRHAPRSEYLGTETYLSLVDAKAAPHSPDLQQLGVRALCTNRHLPLDIPIGVSDTDFLLDVQAPVLSIRCTSRPTAPRPSYAEGDFAWRLVSHLSLNYLSLLDSGKDGAAGLRDLLRLYGDGESKEFQKQLEGVVSVNSKPILRRSPRPGPLAFARGLEITLTFDENAYEGLGVFLLGTVLEQFFARYAAINSFTETIIRTTQRGEIIHWPPTIGKRHLL